MDIEPELKAMNEVYGALKDLDDEAKQRVINWVAGKFSLPLAQQLRLGASSDLDKKYESPKKDLLLFDSVAEVISKASVKTDSDKVLVTAAYLQEKRGSTELTGREINKELHHLGHGVKNITSTITSLMHRKPQLMIQTRKEGKSKQAQKKYKVTEEGLLTAKKKLIQVNTE